MEGTRVLQKAYSSLMFRFVDLLNDMGEAEAFVIDGDSLLHELLKCPRMRSAGRLGPPLLPIVYGFEDFLKRTEDCGGSFKITFFRCNEVLWMQQPAMLAVRRLLLSHLILNTTVEVLEFESWWGGAWGAFLADEMPAFVMMSGGGDLCADRGIFLAMLGSLMVHGQHVAFLGEAQHHNGNLQAFLVRVDLGLRRLRCEDPDIRSKLWREVRAVGQGAQESLSHLQPHEPGLREFVQRALPDAGRVERGPGAMGAVGLAASFWSMGFRSAVAVWCCAQVLRQTGCGDSDRLVAASWLARAFILHAVLIEHLALEQRALRAPRLAGGGAHLIEGFLEDVCRWIARGLGEAVRWMEGGEGDTGARRLLAEKWRCKLEFCDAYDGLLFGACCVALAQSCGTQGLSKDVRNEFARGESCLVYLLGEDPVRHSVEAGSLGVVPHAIAQAVCGCCRAADAVTLSGPSTALREQRARHCEEETAPISRHPLVSGFLGRDCDLPLQMDRTEFAAAAPETHHWHVMRPLEPTFL
eukprot:evm.model.scf_492.8 EVM.evm.TU.scf_492.8   scf_492:27139-29752(+)